MSTIHQPSAGAGVADAAQLPTGRAPYLNAAWVSGQEGSRNEIATLPPPSFGSPPRGGVDVAPHTGVDELEDRGLGVLVDRKIVFDVNP